MPRGSVLENLIDFGAVLRARGLAVHTGGLIDLATGLTRVDLGRRDEVYHACRTILVDRHDDFPIFDRAFAEFFEGADRGAGHAAPDAGAVVMPATLLIRTWSDTDAIATKDFAALTEQELAMAKAAIAGLAWDAGVRKTRRWIRGHGARVDLRRALSRSLRTGGELIDLPRRRRRTKPRPIVLLCDVSGSMERYSRTLLHFAHALAGRSRRVEAFLFATRLTRITRELRAPAADAAIAAAARVVQDWSGGTRIGAALRAFHQRWGRRVLGGGPVVLVISDGWDRGDPQILRDEIARLQRSCHRLIWLNPLIGTEGYEPLTRGLQAALPHVDDFLPVRTLRDVRDLALHLSALQGRHS